MASFYLLLTYKPEKRSRNTDGHLLILFFPLQLNFNLFQRTLGFCPMQLPLEAVIKDKKIWTLPVAAFGGKFGLWKKYTLQQKKQRFLYSGLYIKLVLIDVSTNRQLAFWKATSVRFYLNILIWVVFRKIKNQNPLMSLAVSWDSS